MSFITTLWCANCRREKESAVDFDCECGSTAICLVPPNNVGAKLTPELIEKLKKLAARETWTDDGDFDPCSFSGGNYDDAYYGGNEDGQTQLSREILESLYGLE